MARPAKKMDNGGANLGFEATLWSAADKLRGNMEPSDYKHVALGLIFLKYISDAFAAKHDRLLYEAADPQSDLFVRDERARYAIAEGEELEARIQAQLARLLPKSDRSS